MLNIPTVKSERFRQVMGEYPTGVTVVTSVDASGRPRGMALGSFTSVSLDPPLVAFLVDRSSTTWPSIRDSQYVCVNVLSKNQESLCRSFATRGQDRFRNVPWSKGHYGAPILDGAVAWMDCAISDRLPKGDHELVLARVMDLGFGAEDSPLLFYRGGYGTFTSTSLINSEVEFLSYVRMANIARPTMSAISRQFNIDCSAAVLMGDELAYIAHVAGGRANSVHTRVGWRLPFIPPVGATFAACGDDKIVGRWLKGCADGDLGRQKAIDILKRVRAQGGLSIGVSARAHSELWNVLSAAPQSRPRESAEVQAALHQLLPCYGQEALTDGALCDLQTLSVPIFDNASNVIMQLTLFDFDAAVSESELNNMVDMAQEASQAISSEVSAAREGA